MSVVTEQNVEAILSKVKQSEICACRLKGELKYYRLVIYNPETDDMDRYDISILQARNYASEIAHYLNAGQIRDIAVVRKGKNLVTEDEGMYHIQNLSDQANIDSKLSKILAVMSVVHNTVA